MEVLTILLGTTKGKNESERLESYEVLYKKLLADIKKENISMPKTFIAKPEDCEEWVEEEDTYEDEGIKFKGLMDLIKDSLDGVLKMCDTDISQVVKESSQNLEHTRLLDNGCFRHITGLKSHLTYFVEKDGLIVVCGDNREGAVMCIGTFECKALKLKNVLYLKGLKSNLISISRLL